MATHYIRARAKELGLHTTILTYYDPNNLIGMKADWTLCNIIGFSEEI